MSPLHPDLAHVAMLLGSWSGTGSGEYPTIEPFRYAETISVSHVGKPFLAYGQRTRALGGDDVPGLPLHAETGFWRFPAPGRVEIVLAHPSGITEIQQGTLHTDPDDTLVVEVSTSSVGLTTTAKSVTGIERTFRVRGDVLEYTVRMAAVGRPMTHHLAATLHRDPPERPSTTG